MVVPGPGGRNVDDDGNGGVEDLAVDGAHGLVESAGSVHFDDDETGLRVPGVGEADLDVLRRRRRDGPADGQDKDLPLRRRRLAGNDDGEDKKKKEDGGRRQNGSPEGPAPRFVSHGKVPHLSDNFIMFSPRSTGLRTLRPCTVDRQAAMGRIAVWNSSGD